MSEFLINTVPLKLVWNPNWEIYEIEVDDWDGDKDFKTIVRFKRAFSDDSNIVEIHGRLVIIIPKTQDELDHTVIPRIRSQLDKLLGRTVSFNKISEPLSKLENDDSIREVLRKGIGEIITSKLEKLSFEKIGSGGGIGEFSLPPDWDDERQEIKFEHGLMQRVFRLSIISSDNGKEFYITADIKGRYREKEYLSHWLELPTIENMPVGEWKDSDKTWQFEFDESIKKIIPKEITREYFEIQEIKKWDDVKDKNLNLGRYASSTLNDLKRNETFEFESFSKYALVKPYGRVFKNPNIIIPLPITYFYRHLSQPISKNPEYEDQFKRFTQIDIQKRYHYITNLFKLLQEAGISKKAITFRSHHVNHATPGVKNRKVQDYGRIPHLDEWGIEKWGLLKKIPIYYSPSKRLSENIEKFADFLKEYVEKVLKSSSLSNHVDISIHPIKDRSFHIDDYTKSMDSSYCPIFIKGRLINDYKGIKSKLTQERRIPVQFIRENTINNGRMLNVLARTVFPQILAKSGGMPYKLSPPILDDALIVGLDKARDSSGRRPSASAGIAAVTPDGNYVAGASTELENNTTDFIDVDKLAPQLLKELQEKRFDKDYKYVVILRDGSPKTCEHEVPLWKKYLEEYNKEFIFLSSRKTHPYRIFPSNIADSTQRRVQFKIPAVLNGIPLSEKDFLVLTANAQKGTPKPMLYTLMENTTSLTDDDVKEKVLAQVISMSMLCWESPMPTSQPLPLHYADKLAEFTQLVQQAWNSSNRYPMFI